MFFPSSPSSPLVLFNDQLNLPSNILKIPERDLAKICPVFFPQLSPATSVHLPCPATIHPPSVGRLLSSLQRAEDMRKGVLAADEYASESDSEIERRMGRGGVGGCGDGEQVRWWERRGM